MHFGKKVIPKLLHKLKIFADAKYRCMKLFSLRDMSFRSEISGYMTKCWKIVATKNESKISTFMAIITIW